MLDLHVGRGTDRGGLTVFPVWGSYTGPRGYAVDMTTTTFGERPDGPTVGQLTAENAGSMPVLLVEGQLLEGGQQHRMLTRSVLLPPQQALDLDVVCVEQGRWGGGLGHRASGRRASMRARNVADGSGRQHEVWRRISEYDVRFGANATDSLAAHADSAADEVDRIVDGLRPLPGQIGVVFGIAGQPVMLEAFDNSSTLRREFDSIVRAAAFDAVGAPSERTPARRAVRFVDRAGQVSQQPLAAAGVGVTVGGSSSYVSLRGLSWRRRLVHLKLVNPRHALNVS